MPDLEVLLLPISDTSPGGDDLSYSSDFDAIQEARRSDDATLDQGEWVTELKTADWPGVVQRCSQLLATRSKDLRLAAWIAEAGTHIDGFAGLASGYRLVAELSDRHWDAVHPLNESGDGGLRIGTLTWLLEHSIGWMRTIPLTDAPHGCFTVLNIEAAARHTDNDQAPGQPDRAQIDAARAATPLAFYDSLLVQVASTQEALQRLEQVINAKLGTDAPSFTRTRDTLESMIGTVQRMAAAAGATLDESAPATTEPPADGSRPSSQAILHGGAITSRDEALMELRRVAEFFHRTEPHSPVAYLAERAARWGRMPLHVWLKTVLKDNPALPQLEELLGVPPQVGDGDADNQ